MLTWRLIAAITCIMETPLFTVHHISADVGSGEALPDVVHCLEFFSSPPSLLCPLSSSFFLFLFFFSMEFPFCVPHSPCRDPRSTEVVQVHRHVVCFMGILLLSISLHV